MRAHPEEPIEVALAAPRPMHPPEDGNWTVLAILAAFTGEMPLVVVVGEEVVMCGAQLGPGAAC